MSVNSEIFTQGILQYHKYGNLCIIGITGYVVAPNQWTDYKLCSRIPNAKYGYVPPGIFQVQDTQKSHAAYVSQSGELYVRTENSPIDGWMRGQVIYICN